MCAKQSQKYIPSSTFLDIPKLLSTANVLIILTAASMRFPVFSHPHQTWSYKTFNLCVKCCLIVLNCTLKITTEIEQQIILKRPNAITFRQNSLTSKHHFHTLFVILLDAYTSLSSSTGLQSMDCLHWTPLCLPPSGGKNTCSQKARICILTALSFLQSVTMGKWKPDLFRFICKTRMMASDKVPERIKCYSSLLLVIIRSPTTPTLVIQEDGQWGREEPLSASMCSLLCTVDTSHQSVLWGIHPCRYLCLFCPFCLLHKADSLVLEGYSKQCPLPSPSRPVNSGLGPRFHILSQLVHTPFIAPSAFFVSLVADRALGILLIIATLTTNRTQHTKIRLSICRIEKHLLTKHFPELHLLRSTRGS